MHLEWEGQAQASPPAPLSVPQGRASSPRTITRLTPPPVLCPPEPARRNPAPQTLHQNPLVLSLSLIPGRHMHFPALPDRTSTTIHYVHSTVGHQQGQKDDRKEEGALGMGGRGAAK